MYTLIHTKILLTSDPSQDEYTLIKISSSKEHVCVPSGELLKIPLSKLAMLQAVEVDPIRFFCLCHDWASRCTT